MKIDPKEVYKILQTIKKGRVTTYKSIADKLNTKGYRAIGKIIGKNPNAPQVPCHRVVKSDGSIGGYAFGIKNKISILKSEGIEIKDDYILNFKKVFIKI